MPPFAICIVINKEKDFADLYLPQWSNALCEKRKHLDVLGVGAYANGELIGLAGCSADCEMMYQIGVDVLPEYRRKGVASAVTSRLVLEILALARCRSTVPHGAISNPSEMPFEAVSARLGWRSPQKMRLSWIR